MTNNGDLLDAMDKHFDKEDVREICFKLGTSYENLSGSQKRAKILSLIEDCIRQGSIPTLIDICSQNRKKVDFEKIYYYSPSKAGNASEEDNGSEESFQKENFRSKPLLIGVATTLFTILIVIVVIIIRIWDSAPLAVTTITETSMPSTNTIVSTGTTLLPTNTLVPSLIPSSPTRAVTVTSPTVTKTNTPSPTSTTTPAVTPSPEIESEVLSIGWPSYCVKNTIGEQLILQLKPTDDPIACLNPKVYQELGDFVVEWNVRIGGVAAILLVGNESKEYWLGVLPQNGQIHFQIIDKENQEFSWDDKGYYDVPTMHVDDLNKIQFVRTNSEIVWYINGERIYIGEDEIFWGEIATIQVGIGASGQGENIEDDTIVTFDHVSISFPTEK